VSQSDSQFGKYQLLDRIAAGGMAEIYRARLTGAAGVTKSVVIKKILPHYAGNSSFISMFINEARIAMGLSHGNIAQIFDFGEIDGDYFLAMEYVHGQPLSKVLKRARSLQVPVIPTPFAVLIVMELCKGLHYAHTRLDDAGRPLNIIHRDVSPQNVIISYEGQVKIVDFGIAKARTAGNSETEAGSVKGKYVYFAPEQARGKELDSRADIFAAGIVLYELLCGRLPFEGKMIDVLSKIARGVFPSPRSVNPDITPALERILLTAMAHEKKDRYPTAEAFQEALATYLYKHAPTFSASSLSNLMSYLFEPELVADGRPVSLPRDFLEQVPLWRKVLPSGAAEPASSVQVTSAARGQSQARDAEEDTHTERPSPRMTRRSQRALFIGAPLLAAGIAALLVVLVGRLGTFTIRLESRPPGAAVTVDGKPSGSVTPQLISNLRASQAHRIEVSAPGMKTWVREQTGESGGVVTVLAELEPDRLPADLDKPEKVEPPPVTPAPEPEKSPDDVAMSADYPVSSFQVNAKTHVFNVPPSKAARIRLDPKKTYKVWTDGRLSLGGPLDNILVNEALFFLEGGDHLAAKDTFGTVTPKPRLIKGATALYAFILDISAGDNSGALKVRIQEKGSPQVSTLLVDPHAQAIALDNAQRFTLGNLDQQTTYELTIKDAAEPAKTRAGKLGRVGKVVYEQNAGFSVLEGKKWANETQRVLEVGKTYSMSGAVWMYFTFLDDTADDNAGALQIEIVALPGRGLSPKP
jgi:serine/threonine protein kinase